MINPSDDRFPFCLVWTTLPCISWLLPWIGHVGICDSQGIIYDFLGYRINKKKMAFGKPIKYVPLNCHDKQSLDKALEQGNHDFSTQGHDLCCNNCHHHVAHVLNLMCYNGRNNWGQVSVWWMCLADSNYVHKIKGPMCVYLPLMIIAVFILLMAVLAS